MHKAAVQGAKLNEDLRLVERLLYRYPHIPFLPVAQASASPQMCTAEAASA